MDKIKVTFEVNKNAVQGMAALASINKVDEIMSHVNEDNLITIDDLSAFGKDAEEVQKGIILFLLGVVTNKHNIK